MTELTIAGVAYRTGKLSAFQQMHIVRRITPCLGRLADAAGREPLMSDIVAAIEPLKDEDVEYICNACLSVTERRQTGGGWAPLRVKEQTMYDLSLPVMLQIAWAVIRENLSDFFSELPSGFSLEEMTAKLRSPG